MNNAIISRGNSKFGKIPNVSLTPVKSCPIGVDCASRCCALKSYRMYPSVRAAWDHNLDSARNDPDTYFASIDAFISRKSPAFFRWHVAGDILNQEYADSMASIALGHPTTRFLAYTKTGFYSMATPKNLVILHSTWLDHDPVAGAKNFTVYFSMAQLTKAKATPCAGDCTACKLCYMADRPINIGVVIH